MDHDRIPVLPPGVTYLMQALNDDNMGFGEIAATIETLPSIAARILALANSAWSSPVTPVLSLELACSRLGLQVVRTASIALAIAQPFNPSRCPPFDGPTFWTTAMLNAEAASLLAAQTMRDRCAVARTTGLLSNLGLIWLAESLPTQTAAALEESHDAPPGRLNSALAAHCGLGFDQAGGLLAEAWSLPEELGEAIARQFDHDYNGLALCAVVSGAREIVGAVMRDLEWSDPDPSLFRLGLTRDSQLAVYNRLVHSKARTVELATVLFAKN